MIKKAEHLDENRTFIEDFYDLVKARDNNWTSPIPSEHYIRVVFEKNLTSDKDITLYARSNETNASIKVYERDENISIADFGLISEDKEYKVYLTNLNKSQDTFDLKIVTGSIAFDYIVDPEAGLVPNITFQGDTPANGSSQSQKNIVVNVSSTDDNSEHYTFVDFDGSLVGWWRFDDRNSSGGAVDISRYGNNGSLRGNTTINSTSYWGNASQFDGAGDDIVMPYYASLNVTKMNVSVSAWVNRLSNGTEQVIYNDGSICGWSFQFFTSGGGDKLAIVTNGDCGTNGASTLSNANVGNGWNHVAIVSSYLNSTRHYINGVEDKVDHTVWIVGNATTSGGVQTRIGSTNSRYFNGSIDDLLIFNRSLSAQEIKALYNASANKYFNNFTDLVNGTHIFRAHAVDLAGNRNQTDHRTVIIDITNPEVFLLSPTNGTTVTANLTYFNARFTDNTNVSNATLHIWNASGSLIGTNFSALGNNSISANISFSLNYSGTFFWNYLAVDNNSNQAFNNTNYTLVFSPPAQSDDGGSTGVSGGGGGSGGIITFSPPLNITTFELKEHQISLKIKQGETKEIEFSVINPSSSNVEINLSSDLEGMIRFEKESFTLGPRQTKVVRGDIIVKKDKKPDVYIGRIYVISGNIMREILLTVEIVTDNPLFDIRVQIAEDFLNVYPGGEIKADISLIKFLRDDIHDVTIKYVIKDYQGDVILSETDTRAIETTLSFTRNIQLPYDIKEGKYLLYVELSYADTIASSSAWFNISQTKKRPVVLSYFLFSIVLFLIIVIILLVRELKKMDLFSINMTKE